MAVPKPKSKGAYAPLANGYYHDDSILAAGESAELLWVRLLSFLAGSHSDGFVTEKQLRFAVGVGLRNVPARARRLQEVGLIEAVDGGFVARSWLKWNRSMQEVGIFLKRDRERKASKQAEVAQISARNPSGTILESRAQYSTEQDSTVQKKASPSRRAETRLPKDWSPTPEHEARAVELRVNCKDQAESFRLHAEAHDRHAANWNAAFTMWLKKAAPAVGSKFSPDKEWMARG